MTQCKYFNEHRDLDITDMNQTLQCMNCGIEVRFGIMFATHCSDKCNFYHKYVCPKCMESQNKSDNPTLNEGLNVINNFEQFKEHFKNRLFEIIIDYRNKLIWDQNTQYASFINDDPVNLFEIESTVALLSDQFIVDLKKYETDYLKAWKDQSEEWILTQFQLLILQDILALLDKEDLITDYHDYAYRLEQTEDEISEKEIELSDKEEELDDHEYDEPNLDDYGVDDEDYEEWEEKRQELKDEVEQLEDELEELKDERDKYEEELDDLYEKLELAYVQIKYEDLFED